MVGRRADWSVFSRRLITPELDAGRSVNYRLTTHMISPAVRVLNGEHSIHPQKAKISGNIGVN